MPLAVYLARVCWQALAAEDARCIEAALPNAHEGLLFCLLDLEEKKS